MALGAEVVEGRFGFGLAVVAENDGFGIRENGRHWSLRQDSIESPPYCRKVSDRFLADGATIATLFVELDETFVVDGM